jgi:hypothetical protein
MSLAVTSGVVGVRVAPTAAGWGLPLLMGGASARADTGRAMSKANATANAARRENRKDMGHRKMRVIETPLAVMRTFVFLGKRQPFDKVDYDLILSDFDRLLPLFEYVESGGKEFSATTSKREAFPFRPGFTE